MKKIVTLSVLAVLGLSLASCCCLTSKKEAPATEETATTEAAPEATATEATTEAATQE